MILTSTWVSILLSEYQNLTEYLSSISIWFSPNLNIVNCDAYIICMRIVSL